MQDEFQFPPAVDDVIHQVDDAVQAPSEAEISASWHVLSERLEAIQQRETSDVRPYRGVSRRSISQVSRWVWSVGAVIGIAFLYGAFGLAKSTWLGTTRTYATGPGQQATLILSDGSRVTLAPRTTLKLVRFGTASRTVEIDGQGYFEVSHSSGTPFFVRSGTMITRALGTAFLVRHYSSDEQVHVAVAEGKVSIAPTGPNHWPVSSPVMLTAGFVGDITDSTVHVSTVNDLSPETDWLRGRLVFRHVLVEDVLRTLNRWYGYQFRCSDSTLTHQQVTLALNAQSSTAALSTLSEFLSVNLTVVGDTVTLTPNPNRTEARVPRKQTYDVWMPTREAGR